MQLFDVVQPSRRIFTRTEDGKVIALVELVIIPDILGQRPAGYIHHVNTDQEYRNRGYASELVKEAIEFARKSNCYKVFLICDQSLENLYERTRLVRQENEIVMRVLL